MSKKIRGKKRAARFFLYVVLLLLSAFYLLPFVWMVRSSLMPMYQIFTVPPILLPDPVEWGN